MATNMTEHVIGRVGLQIEAKDWGEPSELRYVQKAIRAEQMQLSLGKALFAQDMKLARRLRLNLRST